MVKQNKGKADKRYDSYILPGQSRRFLTEIKDISEINLYLMQNRYYFYYYNDKGDNKKMRGGSLFGKEIKSGQFKDSGLYGKKAAKLMGDLNARNKKLADDFLLHSCYSFIPYDRLLLGDGSSNYIDMQTLRLHPLYGIPFLPASVIKGTLRSVWILERFGGSERKAEADDCFVRLFGGQGTSSVHSEGILTFFDTYPEKFAIGVDIQTVHYNNYYNRSAQEPTDDQPPVPVNFVCLQDVAFAIRLGCNDSEAWASWSKDIDDMMECMITQYGLGAKTALGYGQGTYVKLEEPGNACL